MNCSGKRILTVPRSILPGLQIVVRLQAVRAQRGQLLIHLCASLPLLGAFVSAQRSHATTDCRHCSLAFRQRGLSSFTATALDGGREPATVSANWKAAEWMEDHLSGRAGEKATAGEAGIRCACQLPWPRRPARWRL